MCLVRQLCVYFCYNIEDTKRRKRKIQIVVGVFLKIRIEDVGISTSNLASHLVLNLLL